MDNKLAKIWQSLKNIKNLTIIGLAQIISSVSLAVFWFILARLIETDQYGEISYYLSIASIAGTFSLLGAGNTLLVLRGKQVQIQTTFYYMVFCALVVTSISLIFILGNLSANVYVVGYVLFALVTTELLGSRLYSSFTKIVISQRILMVSLGISFYFLFGFEMIILGLGLSFMPYIYLVYHGIKKEKFDFSLIRNRTRFLVNNYLLDLARISYFNVDRIIIPTILGFSILGNYQLGVQIVSLTYLLPSTVFQYILPRESSGSKDSKLKKITIIFSVFVVGIVVVSAPIVIPNLFPKFADTVGIVQIMSFQLIPASITFMIMSKFMAEEKSKFIVMGSVIGIITRIAIIYTLGTMYGIIGIAISFVLSSCIEAMFLLTIRHVQKNRMIRE